MGWMHWIEQRGSPTVQGFSAAAAVAAAAAAIVAGRLGKEALFWKTCKILLSGGDDVLA